MDVSQWQWAAPMYDGIKSAMVFVIGAEKFAQPNGNSTAEGAMSSLNHSHYKE